MNEIVTQTHGISKFSRTGEFLKSLALQAFLDLTALQTVMNYEANTILFTEGDAPFSVSIVLEGQLRLFVHSSTGRRLIFRNAVPGDILGLAAAFETKNHDMTAQTIYPCSIACIRRQDFMSFLQRHPTACQSAARELSRECLRSTAKLRNMALTSSAQSRLAQLLLEWSIAGQQTIRGRRFRLPMTHSEVGDCIGSSRETITRTMNDLQRERVLEMNGSLVTILDMPELEHRSIGK